MVFDFFVEHKSVLFPKKTGRFLKLPSFFFGGGGYNIKTP